MCIRKGSERQGERRSEGVPTWVDRRSRRHGRLVARHVPWSLDPVVPVFLLVVSIHQTPDECDLRFGSPARVSLLCRRSGLWTTFECGLVSHEGHLECREEA